MKLPIALLACLLPFAVSARAETPPVAAAQAEAPDVIVPLNVRDPSALVMGPGDKDKQADVAVAPAPRAEPDLKEVKVAKTAVDKTPIRRDRRAVAVPMDGDQLLWVKPGDRVDLIAVFDTVGNAGAGRSYATTILQYVRVLGVATTDDLRAKGVLTLELNPNEAQYALLLARRAELGVIVRGPEDPDIHPMEMALFGKLFR